MWFYDLFFSYSKYGGDFKMCKNNTKICSICRTGMETYLLDPHELFCPYLHFLKENDCKMFRTLKDIEKKRNEED